MASASLEHNDINVLNSVWGNIISVAYQKLQKGIFVILAILHLACEQHYVVKDSYRLGDFCKNHTVGLMKQAEGILAPCYRNVS